MPTQLNAFINAYRGDYIEDQHNVSLIIKKPNGETLFTAGKPDMQVHMRSSAKPFQAQALFQSGAYQKYQLSLKELALCCASHEGSQDHIGTANAILKKQNLNETALNCGAHQPSDKEQKTKLQQQHAQATAIHNNCSGKHAGMLAIANALSAPLDNYESINHPVQQLIFESARVLANVKEIPHAIDGCSLPTFILSLGDAATLYTRLADPNSAPEAYQTGLKTVFEAMQSYPDMIAGHGVIDTEIMKAIPTVAVKRGAQGYYGIAVKQSKYGPLGITLKVEDGSNQARDVFIIEILEYLNILDPKLPMKWRDQEIVNHRGIVTGRYQAEIVEL